MKRIIALILGTLLLLTLCACVGSTANVAPDTQGSNTEGQNTNKKMSNEEILLSQKWINVMGMDGTMRFDSDATGYFDGNGTTFTFDWQLSDNIVSMQYSYMGVDKDSSFEMIEENGFILLKASSGPAIYTLAEDAEAAMEIYKTEEPKVIEYYEECTTLPTIDSSVDATFSGKNTSSSNGVTTKILYHYNGDSAALQDYCNYLLDNGFVIEMISSEEYNIVENKYIIATVTLDGSLIDVSIIPESKLVMSASNAEPISIGQTITTSDCEFTLTDVEIIYELKPENTSGWYTSYESGSGNVYVHIEGEYYNTSKRDVCIRDLFVATADYDGGYTYEGFALTDEGDNDFTWVSSYIVCTPLNSCNYHCLIECPEVIDSSDAPLFVTFTLGGITYRYDIR